MASAVRSSFESYLSSNINGYVSKANYWCGMFDEGFGKLGQHSAALGQHIAKLSGNSEAEEKCRSISNALGDFREGICAIRFIFPIYKLFSGQTIFQTTDLGDKGWRRVAYDKHGPIRISREERMSEWQQIALEDGSTLWQSGTRKSADGKYIDSLAGGYVKRDWMDIAMDVLIFVARMIAPVRWLHNLKTLDLGEHANAMLAATMALWAMVLGINLVQSTRELVDFVDELDVQKRAWDCVQGFIDLLALPFEFGVGQAHPALAIIGTSLNVISALNSIVKEHIYYS